MLLFLLILSMRYSWHGDLLSPEESLGRYTVAIWRAQAENQQAELMDNLQRFLEQQYDLQKGGEVAHDFAIAMNSFAALPRTTEPALYYRVVLPHLKKAYTALQQQTHLPFEPLAVAEKELAWWLKRQSIPSLTVEALTAPLADFYVTLLKKDPVFCHKAAYVQALAAFYYEEGLHRHKKLQDQDWSVITHLLIASYGFLSLGTS